MKPVYLTGYSLASVLGLDLAHACTTMRQQSPAEPVRYTLPGRGNGSVPYFAIPYQADSWNERARNLIVRAATDAQADRARHGALFIATSAQDTDAAEQDMREMDFHSFAERIAGWLDWQGPVYLVSTACTSSMTAMLSALELLRSGEVSEALVIGMELDNHLTVPGFASLQLLTQSSSKPFAATRDGLILGEAVAALRLSTHEPAPWQVLGGANVVDGAQPTGASEIAVMEMCQRALMASGIQSRQIDLVKVQAAGSPGNDAVEAAGLRQAFIKLPALVSLKPLIGHCMGASGAAEIALLLACLENGLWPNCPDGADPALGVQLADGPPPQLRRLLATILGFGGGHAAVVLERSPR
ncbi:MAG: beta-ketoacyl synthase N-terminal-like domain-containing protein [Polaromonas sp.]